MKETLFLGTYTKRESEGVYTITLDTEKIKAVMINEIVPPDPEDDFYGKNETPYYHTTVFPLFHPAYYLLSPALSIRQWFRTLLFSLLED